MSVTNSTELAFFPAAVALGKFDGLHRGHQRVIQPILKARETGEAKDLLISPASSNFPVSEGKHVYSTVVTFNPHPQEFFSGKPRALLTPLDEKVQQLRSLGVEQLVLLPFDRELCSLTPEEFVEKILVEQLQATQVSVGYDFHFGSKRSGTAQDLQIIAARYNIPVAIAPLETEDGDSSSSPETNPISTSFIREVLETGDVERAKQLLGRAYSLIGTVTKGQQLGRTIGFPTANLELPKDKFLPRLGVYAVRIYRVSDTSAQLEPLAFGVMNIGNRPTINGINTIVEVHLFDWSDDLYGQKLAVQLEKFIRPETKFPSLEALKSQIQQDCITAKVFFDT
ncbi:bifunctional riboflavin kinase/FMN adenylyltransferase [Brunnivagina elsteri CCALA 953]|uniref:Riboflavin biosynthesis protein n=1 Tax=Brunnivagina elsteri CCALA 953 TaxID=987040 RepID=A0A2A2TF20_9CYAN|nr:bifunctional riboflavin kinase/FMN adenylyltransferase [Calothrix elsteri CCALA 953]